MKTFILETDWWTDCDDALAIRILARAHKRGDIDLAGIIINAAMPLSAASLDGFLYLEGAFGIPLAIDEDASDFGGNPPYQKNLAPYAKNYKSNSDCEDGVKFYRKYLASCTEMVEIIEIGYLQVIANLIKSGPDSISPLTGRELLEKKVSKIWVMAGKWDEEGGVENNFARNVRSRLAAHIFCDECPCPVTFLGFEQGADVISGSLLKKDDHLYRVLADHGSQNGRSSWDPMLAVIALCGNEKQAGYDTVSGTAAVDAVNGQNYFTAKSFGRHKIVQRMYGADYYQKIIDDLIS